MLAARKAARLYLQQLARAPAVTPRARSEAGEAKKILARWRSYRLQAFGITEERRRVIYLNFVTPVADTRRSWSDNEIYNVSDGGTQFWQAVFDPRVGKILWHQANGLG